MSEARAVKALREIAQITNDLIAIDLALTRAESEMKALEARKERSLAKLYSAILSSEPVDADAS